jgi:hypothetical protein
MTAKGRPLTVEDVRAWHATEEALGERGTWTDATRVCVRLLLTEIDRLENLAREWERRHQGLRVERHIILRRLLVSMIEADRLRALLESGAEQVHGMGRELMALRRQVEDARRDAGAFLRELEQT